MNISIKAIAGILCLLCLVFSVVQGQEKSTNHQIMEQYCFDCHDDLMQKGSVNFEELFKKTKNDAISQWTKTWEVLKNDLMPPPHKKQLSNEQKRQIFQYIEKEIFEYNPQEPDPGPVIIQRLNQWEYQHTVNDLFEFEFDFAGHFPADDTSFGFDNIGAVLTVSPLLMEKYVQASQKIIEVIFPSEKISNEKVNLAFNRFQGNLYPMGNGVGILSSYKVYYPYYISREGDYILEVTATAHQAGPDLAKMSLGVEGIETKEVTIKSHVGKSEKHQITLRLTPGIHRLSIGFLNDFYQPEAKDPKQRDRNLILQQATISGPFKPGPFVASSFEKKWLPTLIDNQLTDKHVKSFIKDFSKKAYRRPLEEDEQVQKLSFYQSLKGKGKSTREAIAWLVQSTLISPHFIFKNINGGYQVNGKQGSCEPIDEYALASKLSYFLWSSLPDERLTNLADKKMLRKELKQEIARMLLDPKIERFIKSFLGQWLQLRDLELKTPSQKIFKDFNQQLCEDFEKETILYFEHVVKENKSILELLDSNYTFLNQRLANHYQIKNIAGNHFRKVELKNHRRGGLLTQGSILTITSYPTRTSLVLRGKYILENILGYIPPNPPPDLPNLADKKEMEKKSLREQIQLHASKESCAACHQKFDPMGYALENYDGIGKWRDNEDGKPINANGVLYTGESFTGPEELKKMLITHKKDLFAKCLIKKLLTYSLGRGLAYYDEITVDQIYENIKKEEYRFNAFVGQVVLSTPFQNQRKRNE